MHLAMRKLDADIAMGILQGAREAAQLGMSAGGTML